MSELRDAARRTETSGTQVDQARALYQDAYNGRGFRIEPSDASFSYRYSSVGDSELTLRGSLFGGAVEGAIETRGEYVVTWLTAGEGVMDLDGDSVVLERGRPAMFVNDRDNRFAFRDYQQSLMHFDGAYLERVAREHEGVPAGPLLFDATAMPDGEALRRWTATVSAVARVLHDDASSPLLRSEANRAAAVSLLETFPHEVLAAPPELRVPSSGRLRRAIEFMHAHAHLPITPTEIADAAGISPRSLQSTFRSELDVTAIDYLRRIRLDRVHDELDAGESGRVTVAEIAGRWGFAHLGRFAAHYAQRFGESPRETLAD